MSNTKFLDLINFYDIRGNNLLLLAIEKGDKESVQMLLESGYDINHTNQKGQNVLTLAYALADKTILKDILPVYEKNINPVIKDSLVKLLQDNELSYLKLFSIDVNKNEAYPLHLAVKQGKLPLVESLLKEGVNINALDKNGESALFQMNLGFSRQNDILKLLKLFKQYNYDFTLKNKNNSPISSLILNHKPTQKIFDYLYNEGCELDLYGDMKNYSTVLSNVIQNIKLNNKQGKELLIDPINKKNYVHLSLRTLKTVINEKGQKTNQYYFDALDKIEANNWPIQIHYSKKEETKESYFRTQKEDYLLIKNIFQLLGTDRYDWYYNNKVKESINRYVLDDYISDLNKPINEQKRETQIIQRIFNKTNLNTEYEFMYNFLSRYSISEFKIDLTQIDLNHEFTFEESRKTKRTLNSVLNEIYHDQYKGDEKEQLKELLMTRLFDIYTPQCRNGSERGDSFICRVVQGFINPGERSTYLRYDDEKAIKKYSYELFLTICENYVIDLEHKNLKGVSLNDQIKGYIKTLSKKEHAEQLLFNLSLMSQSKTVKKIKI